MRHTFNYVRNSVKATVDAYDGTVTLYVVDESDPIIAAWQRAFPSLFTAGSEVPESIRSHFRYPEDLFRVQTNLYGRYQLLDAEEFYSQQLAWSVAQDAPSRQADAIAATAAASAVTTTIPPGGRVSDSDSARFEPYYTIFRAPVDGAQPEFVLFRPFVPFSRNDERKQLQAFMTASSDPATYGKLTAYVIPEPLPDGPLTVASNINQRFSRELTLIDQAGSEVRFGDLQIIPSGGGLIYVRPWFVQAVSSPIPVLDSISVTYSGRSEVGKSLSEALGKLFGVDVDIGDREADTSADTDDDTGTGTGTRARHRPPRRRLGRGAARRRRPAVQRGPDGQAGVRLQDVRGEDRAGLRALAPGRRVGDRWRGDGRIHRADDDGGTDRLDRRHLSVGGGAPALAGIEIRRVPSRCDGQRPARRHSSASCGELLVQGLGEASLLVGDTDLVLAEFVESLLGDLGGSAAGCSDDWAAAASPRWSISWLISWSWLVIAWVSSLMRASTVARWERTAASSSP